MPSLDGSKEAEEDEAERQRVGGSPLCLCLLGSGSLNQRPALLLEQHDVESVEVRGFPLRLLSLSLFGPRALGPLLSNIRFVEKLFDGRSTGASGQLRDDVWGEGGVSVSDDLARNTGGGAVDDCLTQEKSRVMWSNSSSSKRGRT